MRSPTLLLATFVSLSLFFATTTAAKWTHEWFCAQSIEECCNGQDEQKEKLGRTYICGDYITWDFYDQDKMRHVMSGFGKWWTFQNCCKGEAPETARTACTRDFRHYWFIRHHRGAQVAVQEGLGKYKTVQCMDPLAIAYRRVESREQSFNPQWTTQELFSKGKEEEKVTRWPKHADKKPSPDVTPPGQ